MVTSQCNAKVSRCHIDVFTYWCPTSFRLPNVSASVPQTFAAITELQKKGYNIPSYPDNPQTDAEKDILLRYQKVPS
jgi:monomeric isocitrate dehydrogenase